MVFSSTFLKEEMFRKGVKGNYALSYAKNSFAKFLN